MALGLGGLPRCASVERGRYGISRLQIDGMRQMSDDALRACLLTRERDAFTLRIGGFTNTCNQPPFTPGLPTLKLWSWGWTDWPSFNRSVLERDLERVLRWYRARGFYDARVLSWSVDPPEASQGARSSSSSSTARLHVVIQEGEPVRVRSLELAGTAGLGAKLRQALRDAVGFAPGDRFDEVEYDRAKQALTDVLRERSYAGARVGGKVEIDTQLRRARVELDIRPGPAYRFGALRIEGHGELPEAPIRAAAGLRADEPYRPARVEEMRIEVLALNAFASVEVEEQLEPAQQRVNVTLRVAPRERDTLRLGAGVTSGASLRSETGELESIPQWDLHLFASYERRHIAGTLGSLRVEERPRVIFNEAFPTFTDPELGNVLELKIHEPGIIESRTDLFAESSWDYGPDPFLGFRRSDITLRLGARRGFFARHLVATLAVQQDLFRVGSDGDNVTSDGSPTPSSYRYGFLEQDLALDLRDHRTRPRSGAYFALNATEALHSALSDWTSVRLLPDARAYLPLPLSSTLAFRAALGALIIFEADSSLDDLSRDLGPSSYRLRGGGANSVRGFLPGELGAGSQGGVRRWESMLEWRVRLGAPLTAVAFVDVGDVNAEASFRFDQLNTSVGLGFRYFTVIGPLRLDAGFRIVDLQRLGADDAIEDGASTFPFTNVPGALHLTIGDSF
jgi:outer membrane translocation and assembly module TamA